MDSLIVGGVPDYLSLLPDSAVAGWSYHGREITAGDAEKVLDGTPSVKHRHPHVGSGEAIYAGHVGSVSPNVLLQIAASVHNLTDVDAKVRYIWTRGLWLSGEIDDGIGNVFMAAPSTLVGSSNAQAADASAIAVSDVAEPPHGAITLGATPIDSALAWNMEVSFDPHPLFPALLVKNVEDAQVFYVRIRYKGTYVAQDTKTVTIEVKEGLDVIYTKKLRIRAANDEEVITSVLVDPNDFDDPTLTDMSIKVSFTAGTGGIYQELRSIGWLAIYDLNDNLYDTGWVDAESSAVADLHLVAPLSQAATVLPFLQAVGGAEINDALRDDATVDASAAVLATGMDGADGGTFLALFYWNDANTDSDEDASDDGAPANQNSRIFTPSTVYHGIVSNWRPEIGIVSAGPAWGTSRFSFGSRPGAPDQSVVLESAGGNRWTPRRKEPRRTHQVKAFPIASIEAAERLYSVARRTGHTIPWIVCIRPDVPQLNAAHSIYAYMTSIDPPAEARLSLEPGSDPVDVVSVTMSFEEAV